MNTLKAVIAIFLMGQLADAEGTCKGESPNQNSCAASSANEVEADATSLLQTDLKEIKLHKEDHVPHRLVSKGQGDGAAELLFLAIDKDNDDLVSHNDCVAFIDQENIEAYIDQLSPKFAGMTADAICSSFKLGTGGVSMPHFAVDQLLFLAFDKDQDDRVSHSECVSFINGKNCETNIQQLWPNFAGMTADAICSSFELGTAGLSLPQLASKLEEPQQDPQILADLSDSSGSFESTTSNKGYSSRRRFQSTFKSKPRYNPYKSTYNGPTPRRRSYSPPPPSPPPFDNSVRGKR